LLQGAENVDFGVISDKCNVGPHSVCLSTMLRWSIIIIIIIIIITTTTTATIAVPATVATVADFVTQFYVCHCWTVGIFPKYNPLHRHQYVVSHH
jgi:hypothetical protein